MGAASDQVQPSAAVKSPASFLPSLPADCSRLTRYSGAAEALAEDHINDVWSNAGAIVTAAVASRMRQLWWTDPAGGILISALIIYRWSVITASSVAKVVRAWPVCLHWHGLT